MKTKAFFCLVAGFLLTALAPAAFAASVTWTGGGDGYSWGDAHNWSGGVLPGSGDDVTIGVVTGNPTIQFTTAVGVAQINSLTSSEPINLSGGTLQAATTIQLSQVLSLSGGTVKGGTLAGTNGAAVSVSSGTLDGVTSGLITTVPSPGTLNVQNGLTLNNAKLILAYNAQIGGSAAVYFLGTQTLGGTGEVVFGGTGGGNYLYVQGGSDNHQSDAATLTIGANILVHGTQNGYVQCQYAYDSIINQSTINADAAGGQYIYLIGQQGAVTSQGVISASNGNNFYIDLPLTINGQGTLNSSATSKMYLSRWPKVRTHAKKHDGSDWMISRFTTAVYGVRHCA